MREILFRGQTRRLGEKVRMDGTKVPSNWVYGGICHGKGDFSIIYGGMDENLEQPTEKHVVYTDTVGQYTGLRDSKRTAEYPEGQMIFEGDILKIARVSDSIGSYYHPPLDYPVNVVVKWDMCAWMWETLCEDKRYIHFPDAWCHYKCEVIGNIHDNPELLKGGVE